MPVGIEKITAYPCTLSLSLQALAEARGVDPAHPRDELMVARRSLNPTWEDPVTMAVNAARRLLEGEDPEAIELCVVGTESAVDFGKPISSWVQRWAGLGRNVRNFECKHACYGGTGALMMAAHWVASGLRPGRKALVVCSDQSRAHLGKPWEFVLGAAAVAMLVGDRPEVLELDLGRCGYWTDEISDTYRPTARHEVGHADTSFYGYLEALEGAWAAFVARSGGAVDYLGEFARHIYHVPFGGMTLRAHRQILRALGIRSAKEIRESFRARVEPSLRYNAEVGGSYTSATFLALMGLVDASPELRPGDGLTIYSYGSGSCAELYAARLGPSAGPRVAEQRLAEGLAARRPVSVAEYEAIEAARFETIEVPSWRPDRDAIPGLWDSHYQGQGRLVLAEVRDWYRHYELS